MRFSYLLDYVILVFSLMLEFYRWVEIEILRVVIGFGFYYVLSVYIVFDI